MEESELKVGNIVKAIFRNHGNHTIIGIINEISTNEYSSKVTWVGIKVTDGNKKDSYVIWMIKNQVCCLIPLRDIKKII